MSTSPPNDSVVLLREVEPVLKESHRVQINGKTYEMTLYSSGTNDSVSKMQLTEEEWQGIADRITECIRRTNPFDLAKDAKSFEIQLESKKPSEKRAPDAASTIFKEIKYTTDNINTTDKIRWHKLEGDQVTAFQHEISKVFNNQFLESILSKANYIKVPESAIFPSSNRANSKVPLSDVIQKLQAVQIADIEFQPKNPIIAIAIQYNQMLQDADQRNCQTLDGTKEIIMSGLISFLDGYQILPDEQNVEANDQDPTQKFIYEKFEEFLMGNKSLTSLLGVFKNDSKPYDPGSSDYKKLIKDQFVIFKEKLRDYQNNDTLDLYWNSDFFLALLALSLKANENLKVNGTQPLEFVIFTKTPANEEQETILVPHISSYRLTSENRSNYDVDPKNTVFILRSTKTNDEGVPILSKGQPVYSYYSYDHRIIDTIAPKPLEPLEADPLEEIIEETKNLLIPAQDEELEQPAKDPETGLPIVTLKQGSTSLLAALAYSEILKHNNSNQKSNPTMKEFSEQFNLGVKKVLTDLKTKIDKKSLLSKRTENDQSLIKTIRKLICQDPELLELLKAHIDTSIKHTSQSIAEKIQILNLPPASHRILTEQTEKRKEIKKLETKLKHLKTFKSVFFPNHDLKKKLNKKQILSIINVLLYDLNFMPAANYKYKNCFLPLYLRLYLDASDSSSHKSPRFLVLIAKPHGSKNYSPDTSYLTMMQTGSKLSDMTIDNTDVIGYDPQQAYDALEQDPFTLDRSDKKQFQKLIDHVKQKPSNNLIRGK